MLQITQSPPGPVQVQQQFVIAGIASSGYAGRTLKIVVDNQYVTNGPVIAVDGTWNLTFLFQHVGDRVITISVANESQSLKVQVVATPPPVSRVYFTNPPWEGQTGELLTFAGGADGYADGTSLLLQADQRYDLSRPLVKSGLWQSQGKFMQSGNRLIEIIGSTPQDRAQTRIQITAVYFTNPPQQGQTGELLTFVGRADGYTDGTRLLLQADQRYELSRPVVNAGQWQAQVRFTQPGKREIEIIGSAPQDRAQATIQITVAPVPPPPTAISGKIQRAPAGAKGFDTTAVLNTSLARQFKQEGYSFCVRYLSLFSTDDEVADGDLTRSEAEAILKGGLALMVVQHVRSPGWFPSATLGIQTGNHAANNAIFVGLPAGMNVWLDLEGVNPSSSTVDVIDYCNNWFNQVQFVGYVPGIYVGYSSLLSSDQLYYSLKCEHYWQSGSAVPSVSVRGYQLIQTALDQTLNGISIDINQTQNDLLGGSALWLTR